ncbi:MAG: trans-2-enoyl-CoA reductase family protein [Lachnospiraceae bacterium]|nr:trans-2-enoyl-CoA reductase family protein [Lachnospiraceae bacterium]
MIVEPKSKGFICTTAHPTGCCKNVEEQIAYAKKAGESYTVQNGRTWKKALIIGASTGYGLASRIAAAFTCKADTIGVMFERPAAGKRTATAGWYNTLAFDKMAAEEGLYSKSVNGDAFSDEIKKEVIETIKKDLGKVDMVIYSLAAPRRITSDGNSYASVLKTVGEAFTTKSLNLNNNEVTTATLEPATKEEIEGTVKVMGGEDWELWIDALKKADVLEKDALTIAYSYIGPELTYPIYYSGTIGQAKKHVLETSKKINEKYADVKAYVSVNKAVVTQSSSAIPAVPLYLSIMYKVMKEQKLHEGCIEQMVRLFTEKLAGAKVPVDEEGRIRLDDWEMKPEVQEAIMKIWGEVSTENVAEMCDIQGYWDDFFQMFGFRMPDVDYRADVEV